MSAVTHRGGLDALASQRTEPAWMRLLLITITLVFLACFLGVPNCNECKGIFEHNCLEQSSRQLCFT